MDITQFSQINPPQRLLMGPGPINADPRVLRAMSSQLVGQYDPAMTHYMNEVMALYRGVFRTENRWTMLVDGTSRAGIEAILLSAIRPGDKGAGAGVRPVWSSAVRDRASLPGRSAHHRGAVGRGLYAGSG